MPSPAVDRRRTRARALALVAVGALALACSSGGGSDSSTTTDAKRSTTTAEATATTVEQSQVRVKGEALPNYDAKAKSDPAVGEVVPVVSGLTQAGEAVTVPAKGQATMVVFLAHWCPHCQAELPRLVEWVADGGPPEGLAIRAVATSTNEDRPNYPPSAWLTEEEWAEPTLMDSTAFQAATFYGLTGFPYFVFVDADGRVTARASGEQPVANLEKLAATALG